MLNPNNSNKRKVTVTVAKIKVAQKVFRFPSKLGTADNNRTDLSDISY